MSAKYLEELPDTVPLLGSALSALVDLLDTLALPKHGDSHIANLAASVLEEWLEEYDLAVEDLSDSEEEEDISPAFKKIKLTE